MSKQTMNSSIENETDDADSRSLERRMELLESRFTTPYQGHGHTSQTKGQEGSHHSFSFDPPSPLHSSHGGSSNTSNASNLGNDLVRPKKKRARRLSTFDRVNMAAERQMQRVMANSPLQINSIQVHQSPNTTSNQTVVTSHKSSQDDGSSSRVVEKTPPTSAVSPAATIKVGGDRNSAVQKPVPVVRY